MLPRSRALFERPEFLWLLLFAFPLAWWLRRAAPRKLVVGGLAPFRVLRGSTQADRIPVLRLFLALLALGCLSFSLAGLVWSSSPPLLLVDRTFSNNSAQQQSELSELAWSGEVVELYGDDGIGSYEYLFGVIAANPGRRLAVFTDLPQPMNFPSFYSWHQSRTGEGNFALLNLVNHADGVQVLHWAQWGCEQPANLLRNQQPVSELSGTRGELMFEDLQPGDILSLGGADNSSWEDARPQDDYWHVREPLSLLLPKGAHPAWPHALAALFPGAQIFHCDPASGEPPEGLPATVEPIAIEQDPFVSMGELAALAHIREQYSHLNPTSPRSRIESEPQRASVIWSLKVESTIVGVNLAWILAAVGLLFYLAFLWTGRAQSFSRE